MKIEEIYAYADRIGLLTFSTQYGAEVHSRIAHFNGYDQDGIYFRTMGCKPYGRQLRDTERVTVCGHLGGDILNHDQVGAVPEFAPGYTFRLIGEVRYVSAEEIKAKAAGNPYLDVAARDIELYPAMGKGNYMIYRAKGEIFQFDFGKTKQPHKLLRTRFAFGGMDFNEAGVQFDLTKCITCGACGDACSFDAIAYDAEGFPSVISARCDECGSCLEACPTDAIGEPLVF